MPLINCEDNPILTWSENCVISSATGETKFTITDTKLYVQIITLSTQDNAKLLKELRSGFKITINWNKYQSKVSTETQNQYLDFLVDPSFQDLFLIDLFYFLKLRAIEKCTQDIIFQK